MNCVPDFCTSTVNTYPRVVYIHNKLLMLLCSRIPNIQNRVNRILIFSISVLIFIDIYINYIIVIAGIFENKIMI